MRSARPTRSSDLLAEGGIVIDHKAALRLTYVSCFSGVSTVPAALVSADVEIDFDASCTDSFGIASWYSDVLDGSGDDESASLLWTTQNGVILATASLSAGVPLVVSPPEGAFCVGRRNAVLAFEAIDLSF